MKLNFFQKLLSYLVPVKIASAVGKTTPVLVLYRFQGRWQLSAATALYSDGAAYRPLTAAFAYLKYELAAKQNMLVLGAGLGSAVSVFQNLSGYIPRTTLVDIDPQIIVWGKEIISTETEADCTWVCADVSEFVTTEKGTFDLMIVDVFQDRIVPQFVSGNPFLNACRNLLSKDANAVLVLNYIVNNEDKWQEAKENFERNFRIEHIISIGINRILILRNSV